MRLIVNMNKIFSILFAVIILISGMHLSIATHFCGGEISQVKFSFSHEKATCGMCGEEEALPENGFSADNCCQNEMSFLVVDNNYSRTNLEINKPVYHVLQVFDIPRSVGIPAIYTNSALNTNVQPPGSFIADAVYLPDICVFRI